MTTGRIAALRSALRDPLLRNSALMLTTTMVMAAVGALFWIIAARLADRSEVGLASSLVTTTEALAIFAQLGLDVALLRTAPRSDRRASDVAVAVSIVALAGGVLALGYSAVLPAVAPPLARVVHWPLTAVLLALLAAGTAVNMLTDSIFLAINRVASNMWVNGVLLSIVKLAVPFALIGAGAFAIFGAVGGAGLLAAVVSVWVILRQLPDRPSFRPSAAFREARRFAGAGYLSNVLYITPQLVFPILIINARGPADSAVFFISFQVVTLLNHGVYMISNSMYAEVARAPERAAAIVAKAGRMIAGASAVGIAAVVAGAPLLLAIFGDDYARLGTATLRVLALGTLGVAANYWSAVRLRIAAHLRAMVGVQLTTTALMIGLAVLAAPHGIEAVAAAWGAGQLAGGALGYLVSKTIAPMHRGLAADHSQSAAPARDVRPASGVPLAEAGAA